VHSGKQSGDCRNRHPSPERHDVFVLMFLRNRMRQAQDQTRVRLQQFEFGG